MKSCVGFRRCNRADSRLDFEVLALRHKMAMLGLRDSIHRVARSHEVRLLYELGGSDNPQVEGIATVFEGKVFNPDL